jgi:hypothetical protein
VFQKHAVKNYWKTSSGTAADDDDTDINDVSNSDEGDDINDDLCGDDGVGGDDDEDADNDVHVEGNKEDEWQNTTLYNTSTESKLQQRCKQKRIGLLSASKRTNNINKFQIGKSQCIEKQMKKKASDKGQQPKPISIKNDDTNSHQPKPEQNNLRQPRPEATVPCTAKNCSAAYCSNVYMQQHFLGAHCSNLQPDDQPKSCPACDYSTKSLTKFKMHVRKHTPPPPSSKESVSVKRGPFICDVCGKEFSKRTNKAWHVKTVHKKELKFICDLCAKPFRDNCDLRRHRARCRNWNCEYCGKVLGVRQSMKRHVVACKLNPAVQEKTPASFPCLALDCNKVFSVKKQMQVHYRCVHEQCGWQCQRCGQTYRWQASLARHNCLFLPAKSFECKQEGCERKYKSRRAMLLHYKTSHVLSQSFAKQNPHSDRQNFEGHDFSMLSSETVSSQNESHNFKGHKFGVHGAGSVGGGEMSPSKNCGAGVNVQFSIVPGSATSEGIENVENFVPNNVAVETALASARLESSMEDVLSDKVEDC